jgi:hypothetical protein
LILGPNGCMADEEANRLLRGDDRGFRAPFTIPEHL